ncbi:hypothetical protein [Edaphobacter bradus]|uniref:hypothetical protein n=1 Tax=Edaphobacter bradus TaxID=2259016 RepID=UPI0021E02929|nr:hypothetical protein [Edaphobacter bradus]
MSKEKPRFQIRVWRNQEKFFISAENPLKSPVSVHILLAASARLFTNLNRIPAVLSIPPGWKTIAQLDINLLGDDPSMVEAWNSNITVTVSEATGTQVDPNRMTIVAKDVETASY